MKTYPQPKGTFHSLFGTVEYLIIRNNEVRISLSPNKRITLRKKDYWFTVKLIDGKLSTIETKMDIPCHVASKATHEVIAEKMEKSWDTFLHSATGEQVQLQIKRWWRIRLIEALNLERNSVLEEFALLQTKLQTINEKINELII